MRLPKRRLGDKVRGIEDIKQAGQNEGWHGPGWLGPGLPDRRH